MRDTFAVLYHRTFATETLVSARLNSKRNTYSDGGWPFGKFQAREAARARLVK
jgi:hypothetical protein